MKDNIYSERQSSRTRPNQEEQPEFPQELIITVYSLDSPNLGTITKLIRQYLIETQKSAITPVVAFNFCIDIIPDSENIKKYLQKFIALAEYINQLHNQMPAVEFTFMVRGYFPYVMFPLISTKSTILVSKLTIVDELNASAQDVRMFELFNLIGFRSLIKENFPEEFKTTELSSDGLVGLCVTLQKILKTRINIL